MIKLKFYYVFIPIQITLSTLESVAHIYFKYAQ